MMSRLAVLLLLLGVVVQRQGVGAFQSKLASLGGVRRSFPLKAGKEKKRKVYLIDTL